MIAGAALAVAGTEAWFLPSGSAGRQPGQLVAYTYTHDVGVVSAANALALAGLACWGVVLVTRGRFRRVAAVIGLLTALGAVLTVVSAFLTTPDRLREQFEELSISPPAIDSTGWLWVGSVAALLGLLAWIAAALFVRDWPEMGRRYDTPSDSPPEDLWKVLDEGRDPTS